MSDPRILFVDDEETIATNAKALLEREGFAVSSYTSATEALKENFNNLSCAILDWELPEMSGLKLYEEIQRLAGPVPVIFVSGYDLDTDYPFLKKPFRFSTLADHIRTLIRSDP